MKRCKQCGSTETVILNDAYVRWDDETQEYEIHAVYDDTVEHCAECGDDEFVEESV